MLNIYISPDGNDTTGDGSEGSPYKSLEWVVESGPIESGTTIFCMAGAGPNYDTVVWKTGTDNLISKTGANLTIQAHPDNYGQIKIPIAYISYRKHLFEINGTVTWKGLDMRQTWSSDQYLFWLGNNETQLHTLVDCQIDVDQSTQSIFRIASSVTAQTTIKTERCDIRIPKGLFLYCESSNPWAVEHKSTRIRQVSGTTKNLYQAGNCTRYTAINNTFVYYAFCLPGMPAACNITQKNNLFYCFHPTGQPPFHPAAIATHSGTIDIHKNVYWTTNQTLYAESQSIGNMALSDDNHLPVLPYDNWFLNPVVDANYNLGETSKAVLRGDSSVLPEKDLSGISWSGGHIGCYSNPGSSSWSMTPRSNKVVLIGDSIAVASALLGQNTETLTGIIGTPTFEIVGVYNVNDSDDIDENIAIGGLGIKEAWSLVDRAAELQQPEFAIFIVGHGNAPGTGSFSPTALTRAEFVTSVKTMMDKAAAWGMTPIWFGMAPTQTTYYGDHLALHDEWNRAVEAAIDGIYRYDSIQDRYKINPNFFRCEAAGGYYKDANCVGACGASLDCLMQDVHPGVAGQEVILSMVENAVRGRSQWHIADNQYSTNIPDGYAPGTYHHPLSVDGFESLTSLHLGQSGITVAAHGLLAGLTAPFNGSSETPVVLQGGYWVTTPDIGTYWTTDNDIDQEDDVSTLIPPRLDGQGCAAFLADGSIATLQYPGRIKLSIQGIAGAYYWPSAPEIIAVTGIDNAVYNADGTGKTFATTALALAAMATLADDQYLFAGTKAAALYSVDMSEQAARIKRIVGD